MKRATQWSLFVLIILSLFPSKQISAVVIGYHRIGIPVVERNTMLPLLPSANLKLQASEGEFQEKPPNRGESRPFEPTVDSRPLKKVGSAKVSDSRIDAHGPQTPIISPGGQSDSDEWDPAYQEIGAQAHPPDWIAAYHGRCYQCHPSGPSMNPGRINSPYRYSQNPSSLAMPRPTRVNFGAPTTNINSGSSHSPIRYADRRRFSVDNDGSSEEVGARLTDTDTVSSMITGHADDTDPDRNEASAFPWRHEPANLPTDQTSADIYRHYQQARWTQAYMAFLRQTSYQTRYDAQFISYINGGYPGIFENYNMPETNANWFPMAHYNHYLPFSGPSDEEVTITTQHTYLSDYLTLGEIFSFEYRWAAGSTPDTINSALLRFGGTTWNASLAGILRNSESETTEWETFWMYVPESLVGMTIQTYFMVVESYPMTDPVVHLRNLSSTSAPVPEPATVLLLGAGLLAMVSVSRRRPTDSRKGQNRGY